jgi:apolipoprotein N-acyltransferase
MQLIRWCSMRPRASAVLALAAGAILPLAYAPFGLWPIAFLSTTLLFLLWLGCRPAGAFFRGWLFGLGYFGFGVYWVYNSLHEFGHAPPWLAGALTFLLVMALAAFPGIAGYLQARLNRQFPLWLRSVLLMPALWVLLEWARGWVLTGFPWLALGYSQIDAPLAGIAPVLGVFGVSLAVAASSGLLATLLAGRRRGRLAAVAALAALWLIAGLLGRIDWSEPAGGPLRVTLIQGNIPQERKWADGELEPTLEMYLAATREHWDSDLIIWPETAIAAYSFEVEDRLLQPLAREAAKNEAVVMAGLIYYEPKGRQYHNSMVVLGPEIGVYHKRHLVPFGEYIPLRNWLRFLDGLIKLPVSDIDPGTIRQPELRVHGYRVSMSICYESLFPQLIRADLPEAVLLINASNDAWFGDSLAPPQHLEIARMRAREASRYLLRATNTGISAVIGPTGRILARSPQFEQDVLTAEVLPLRGTTPFVLWGNYAVVALTAALVLGALVWAYLRRA